MRPRDESKWEQKVKLYRAAPTSACPTFRFFITTGGWSEKEEESGAPCKLIKAVKKFSAFQCRAILDNFSFHKLLRRRNRSFQFREWFSESALSLCTSRYWLSKFLVIIFNASPINSPCCIRDLTTIRRNWFFNSSVRCCHSKCAIPPMKLRDWFNFSQSH